VAPKFFCVLLFAWSQVLYGQEIASFSIDQNAGLPSNTVYDIFLDSRGFLWVATENGLARYNGHRFTRYENSRIRSRSISGLFEDKLGRIWCHNFFGEILFVENDSLKKLDAWEGRYKLGFPAISNLKDSLLISTPSQIFSYQLRTQTWRELFLTGHNSRPTVRYHIPDHQQRVWVATASSDYARVTRLPDRQTIRIERNGKPVSNNLIHLAFWRDRLLVFDPIEKLLFEVHEGALHDVTPSYQAVLPHTRAIESVGDSILAFMGHQGVHLQYKGEFIELLPGKNVSAVTADREGGIWVSTINEGIFYFPTLQSRLYGKNAWGLFNKVIYDSKSDRVVAGQYNGQLRVFSGTGLEKSILVSDQKEIQSIFIDTVDQRLLVFADQLHYYSLPQLRWEAKTEVVAVKQIVRVGSYYYLATSGGLYRVDVHTRQRQVLPIEQRVTRLAILSGDRNLWVGTQKGVLLFDTETEAVKPWNPGDSIESPGVTALEVVSGNLLMIGTSTNGVFQVRNGKLERHWQKDNGLPSNHITSLSVQGDLVWAGTDRGICSIDPKFGPQTSITVAKGLASEEVYAIAASSQGLWVTHSEGLQQFTQLAGVNQAQPLIHLKAVTSDGERLQEFTKAIQLAPMARQLSLEFDVSNSLKSQGSVFIQYRLNSRGSGSWNNTQLSSPVVNFLSIPPGQYLLEAVAMNEDGVRSSNQLQVPILVLAPLWQRTWFQLLVGAALLTLAAFLMFVRFKRNNERQRAAWDQLNLKQELRIAQLTSIRAQMNPHFIFNTMSLIQSYVLKGMKEEANQRIQQFAQLLRRVLDYSANETIRLKQEIEILTNYLSIENARMDGKLQYHILVDPDVDEQMIEIPTLLTQPYVENAIRHGLLHREDPKILSIRFSIESGCLLISIDDNGIGRVASAVINQNRPAGHQSFAMQAYQKRIELINSHQLAKIRLDVKDKYLQNGQSGGTQVLVRIPLPV
jgi:two-component sensor histidine kinase